MSLTCDDEDDDYDFDSNCCPYKGFNYRVNFYCVSSDKPDSEKIFSLALFLICMMTVPFGIRLLIQSKYKEKRVTEKRNEVMHEQTYCLFTKYILIATRVMLICYLLNKILDAYSFIVFDKYRVQFLG